jgi:murein DD-endopeptidase MepM/ murein hydrolase activator NlpD
MNRQKSKTLTRHPSPIERLLRHRWVAAGVGSTALLGMVAAFALAPPGSEDGTQLQTVLEQLSTPTATLIDTGTPTFLHEERIQRSDTVSSLITRLGITDQEALEFVRTNSAAQSISRQLRPGKVVTATTGMHGELIALYFPLNGKDAMLVVEKRDGSLVSSEQLMHLDAQTVIKAGEIRNSLFGATDAAGIPDAIAVQLAEIFAGDMDFHRDLRKGDRFSLVYETFTHRGQAIRTGRILSAEFINDQKTLSAYWFEHEDGQGTYYSADGKNLRKAFLRSPLEFSRVTSGFTSARLHPVLQTWRAHKGIDYGAPSGTPVRSVADGTVDSIGQQGGYGNLIVIKHQGTYSTAYGHLSGFAAGIRKGSRIRQGDTIAYVGQTGLATGPHLHYEFRVSNQQINPLALNLPAPLPLAAPQMARFKTTSAPLQAQLELARQIQVATAE